MQSTLTLVLFFLLTILVFPSEETCERDQVRQGCRIHQGMCVCGAGCYSEYRYNNKEECRKALKADDGGTSENVTLKLKKGRRNDICQREPCLHQGICSQIIQEPGFRCRCEGTGYYGTRCQYACPGVFLDEINIPYECVVI